MTQSIPPPETSRAPLSAASALAAAVEAVPPSELTLEQVDAKATEALAKATEALAKADAAIAEARTAKQIAESAELKVEQIALSVTRAENAATSAKTYSQQSANASLATKASVDEYLSSTKLMVDSLKQQEAARIEAVKQADEADQRRDAEITKRISVAEIRVADVDQRVGKLEGWISANPKTAGAIGGSLSLATLLGLGSTFGPSLLHHLALAWATAHGLPTPAALPPEPAPIVAPASQPKGTP